MSNIFKKIINYFKKETGKTCYGINIPKWCHDINDYKYKFSAYQKENIRKWYLKNMTNYIEEIPDGAISIDNEFGMSYMNGQTKKWRGYRLCIGDNLYVRLIHGNTKKGTKEEEVALNFKTYHLYWNLDGSIIPNPHIIRTKKNMRIIRDENYGLKNKLKI